MNKNIMISIDDERAKDIADVLGSKTSKNILNLLAEKELSEQDIAQTLRVPINTIEYNLKKLIKAGLIEHSKSFFWSVKGRKIRVYKVSNKSIVIAPKKKINAGLFAALLISGIAAVAIRGYETAKVPVVFSGLKTNAPMLESAGNGANNAITATANTAVTATANLGSIALWFFGGALFSLLIYLLIQKIVRRYK